jgi:hypothetical protein
MRINVERLIWVLWACLIMLVPITTRTSTDGLIGGSLAEMLWTDFLFGIVVLIMLARRGIKIFTFSPVRFGISKVVFVLLLLFVLNYLSIVISGLDGYSMMKYVFSGWVWMLALLTYVVAQQMVRTEGEAAWLRRFFITGYCVVAVIGLMELAQVPAVVGYLDAYYGTEMHVESAQYLARIGQFRLTSTFDRNPHGLALYTMMAITWMTAVLVTGEEHPGWKLASIVLICVGMVLLLGSMTATGIAATVASVLTVLLSRRKTGLVTVIVLVVLLGVGFFVIQFDPSSNPLQKFVDLYGLLSANEQGPTSLTSRLDIWSRIWQLTSQSFSKLLFGISYDEGIEWQNKMDMTADSDYMFMMFYGGILGLGMFLLLYWYIHSGITRALKELRRGNPEREALLLAARGIFFGMVVAGFTGGFMTGSGTARRTSFLVYTLIGASLGVLLKPRQKE